MLPSSYLRHTFLSVVGSLLESLPQSVGTLSPLPTSSNFLLLQSFDLSIEFLLSNEPLLISSPNLGVDSAFALSATRPLMRSSRCTLCISSLELIHFSSQAF